MDTIMDVSGLRFGYALEPVLIDVGFQMCAGDFIALIGPNGAGKSTLLKLLLGELAADKGSIALFGQDIARFKDWPRMGYLPQNASSRGMNLPATAMEVVLARLYPSIGLFRRPGKAQYALARAALTRAGMAGQEKQLFSTLSGGQQQRVLLAGVLAASPDLLILDEPTTGIDAQGVKELMELLAAVNTESGTAVLMVTHDMARASKYAGRVLCLEEGTLVELAPEQTAEELRHKHRHTGGERSA